MKISYKTILTFLFLVLISGEIYSQPYINISSTDAAGNSIELDSLLQKGPVFISFWATWCKPAKDQLTFMQTIYTKYKEQGFSFLAVCQDNSKSLPAVTSYINSNNFTFPVILDSEKVIFNSYNLSEVPTSLLINSRKEIVFANSGYTQSDDSKIEEEIGKILTMR